MRNGRSMVEHYDIPTVEIVPECSICRHPIVLKGEVNTSRHWECDHRCRCLISGCVPKATKYGTA